MGMFDRIKAKFECPACGHAEDDFIWQTKSLDNFLDTYKVGDEIEVKNLKIQEGEIEIHYTCPKCDRYIRGHMRIEDGRLKEGVYDLEAT